MTTVRCEALYDVIALGELLIDFTPVVPHTSNRPVYEQNPGGAPANVLACLSKLGGKGAFIGCVGEDGFGQFLHRVLEESGVDAQGLQYSREAGTTLAFVRLDESGERSFDFRRNPGADTRLNLSDDQKRRIPMAKAFHFGSLSMTSEPSRGATIEAVREAASSGRLVSFDPNLRERLWPDLNEARTRILSVMEYVDVLKVSEEELAFLSGEDHVALAAEFMQLRYSIPLLIVTLGRRGCYYRMGSSSGLVPSFPVQAVDTTGAGDAFMGGLLFGLTRGNEPLLEGLDARQLEETLRFACAVAALCVTGRGAITSMPSPEDAARLLEQQDTK